MSNEESWSINWYVCTADLGDVNHAKSKGETISLGDELWRVPKSIGPIEIDHNHWAGRYLDISERDAHLVSASPELLEACELALAAFDSSNVRIAYEYAGVVGKLRDAIAKAEGRS